MSCSKCTDLKLCFLFFLYLFCFFWTAGGSPGEGHLGVPSGASAASGLDVTEVWLDSSVSRKQP